MKNPKLSYIMPAKNAEAYMAEALNSLLTQSIKGIEIVIVDDHSKDNTMDLAVWYSKKAPDQIVVSRLPEGRNGSGAARNLAIDLARAPIVALLDADDVSDKDRTKRTLEAFKDNKNRYFYGAASTIDFLCREFGRMNAEVFDLEKAIERKANHIVHSTVAFPKALGIKFPFDEGEFQRLGLEDWHQQLRLAKAGVKFEFTPKILSAYRVHDSGLTRTRDEAEVAKLKDSFLQKLGLSKEKSLA